MGCSQQQHLLCRKRKEKMASFHIRSISLPSRSHPLTVSVVEQLDKLKASQSSSLGHKLAGLKELYECFNDFLQLSLTQKTLSQEKQNQSVEEALNGSLGLLDMCSTIRDFFSQMRGCMQGLEASLRRRKTGESVFNEVDTYMVTRKKLKKVIYRYLRNLKKQEKNSRTTASANNSDVVDMLKGVEEISAVLFESILAFISLPKEKSKFSIVPSFFQSKHVSSKEEVEANEIEKIDAGLLVLKSSEDINQVQNALKGVKAMELSLQEAEEELECVYRRLVKIRVSLLNILNH
ncbi:uncharacterized protein LOC8266599 [Ricinus communis]|uniref:uncharacterized protein LOC8266599 n=1 Tax=Ricinus communis TaxID=3988 RepID=UPI00201AE2AC|nr:uncharacterized protein LOC8266599 [Ricinus communis]